MSKRDEEIVDVVDVKRDEEIVEMVDVKKR